jgi:hypothetical protein
MDWEELDKLLMRRIRKTRCRQYLGALLLEQQHRLNYLHISAALCRIAQLHVWTGKSPAGREGAVVAATGMLMRLAHEKVHELRPRELSNIMWAVAKLEQVSRALLAGAHHVVIWWGHSPCHGWMKHRRSWTFPPCPLPPDSIL